MSTEADQQDVPARDQPFAEHFLRFDLGYVENNLLNVVDFARACAGLTTRLRLGAGSVDARLCAQDGVGDRRQPGCLSGSRAHRVLADRRGRACVVGGSIDLDVVDRPDQSILEDDLDEDSLVELAPDHRGVPAGANFFRRGPRNRILSVPDDLSNELRDYVEFEWWQEHR